jgi:hypothetical protein
LVNSINHSPKQPQDSTAVSSGDLKKASAPRRDWPVLESLGEPPHTAARDYRAEPSEARVEGAGMNKDKLARLQAQVRTGGKGSVRRKKKAVHKTTTTGTKESLPRHSVIPPDAPPKSCSAPPPSFLAAGTMPPPLGISPACTARLLTAGAPGR